MKSKPLFAKYIIVLSVLISFCGKAQQYISVDTSYTAEQLVKDIFIGSQNASCITIDNISVTGWDFGNSDLSYGYFSSNVSGFEVNDGILLSSGKLSEAVGSFAGIQSATASGWDGDQDLEQAANITRTTNATILEFDFISNQSNKISFDYMFLSEQYLRNNDSGTCGYTDGFAFLIRKANEQSYTNLAVLPGTNTPITSENVRGVGGKCPANNQEYFGRYNPDYSPVSFNGQTKILTAKTEVVPGVKYHIKLVIADQGNGLYDSGVILKAGSFTGNINIGPDRLISTNNPVCSGGIFVLNATTSGAVSYKWLKDGIVITGATNPTYSVTSEGNYSVEIDLSGCILKGYITIEYQEEPILAHHPNFSLCDSKLNGNIPVKFSEISPQIIQNFNNTFIPKYYLNPIDAQNGAANFLPDNWSYSANTTIYLRVESIFGCTAKLGQINFTIGNKISLLKNTVTKEICDNQLTGNVAVNLNDYKNEFTNDPSVSLTFYNTAANARNKENPISENQTLTASKTFYIRFESTSECPIVGSITLNVKSPKKSTNLKDKIICPNSDTVLDAGFGFTSYLWNTGETSQAITVPVGDYYVDLGFNGCVYRQHVKVTASELPQITDVEVSGNTATVFVTGGNPPYEYSLDGITFQPSNIFTNVPRGIHTVYVKDSLNCKQVQEQFLILNLINVITPDGDGKNDVLDYSDLKIKNNVNLQILNRFGNTVFTSKDGQFIWDGKTSGRPVSTGTYWYILKWTEPQTDKPVVYFGWILVKNRD